MMKAFYLGSETILGNPSVITTAGTTLMKLQPDRPSKIKKKAILTGKGVGGKFSFCADVMYFYKEKVNDFTQTFLEPMETSAKS